MPFTTDALLVRPGSEENTTVVSLPDLGLGGLDVMRSMLKCKHLSILPYVSKTNIVTQPYEDGKGKRVCSQYFVQFYCDADSKPKAHPVNECATAIYCSDETLYGDVIMMCNDRNLTLVDWKKICDSKIRHSMQDRYE